MSKSLLYRTRTLPLAIAALLACGCAHADKQSAEDLCFDTANSYFILVDANKADEVAKLFTEDASVVLGGEEVRGASGVRDYFLNRATDTRMFHHLTTYQIIEKADGSVSGDIYVLIHGESTVQNESGEEQKLAGLFSGIYRDEYVIEDGLCKIKDRRLETGLIKRF